LFGFLTLNFLTPFFFQSIETIGQNKKENNPYNNLEGYCSIYEQFSIEEEEMVHISYQTLETIAGRQVETEGSEMCCKCTLIFDFN